MTDSTTQSATTGTKVSICCDVSVANQERTDISRLMSLRESNGQ
jgi:hypothetical protein